MKSLTKAEADQLAEYRRASDELRKKIVAAAVRDEREILPVNGIVHFPKNCKPLTSEQAHALFGKSVHSFPIVQKSDDENAW